MKMEKRLITDDSYRAAWCRLHKINVSLELRDGKVQFSMDQSPKAVTAFNLFREKPKVELHDFIAAHQKLTAEVQSRRRQMKNEMKSVK